MKNTPLSNQTSNEKSPNPSGFSQAIAELIAHPDVKSMKSFPHHGRVSCYDHSLAVAHYAYKIASRHRLDARSVARGAMLHDFYLYDWHDKKSRKGLHGFTHARKALANAQSRFELNPMEVDIILKHMWPLGLSLPRYRESVLVCLVDKGIALLEVTHLFRLPSVHLLFPALLLIYPRD
jgi:uncharacterized protein